MCFAISWQCVKVRKSCRLKLNVISVHKISVYPVILLNRPF